MSVRSFLGLMPSRSTPRMLDSYLCLTTDVSDALFECGGDVK